MRRLITPLVVFQAATLVWFVLLMTSPRACAQTSSVERTSSEAVHFDSSSKPLRDVSPRFVITKGVKRVKVARSLPIPTRNSNAPLRKPLLQTAASFDIDVDISNYEGLGEGKDIGGGAKYDDPASPSDANASVGRTQYVEWVNNAFGIFDKATGKLILAAQGNVIWSGFGGRCETNNDGDPIVQYDKLANRWVMSQFVEKGGKPFLQCIAVSQTDDAGGLYNRYSFEFKEFNDYGKLGVWPDGYYASFNMFQDESDDAPATGGKACAFERRKMLIGQQAKMVCFDLREPMQMGLLPSDFDGTMIPPSGTPNYFINWGLDQLNAWAFQVNWDNPNTSSFKALEAIKVDSFDPACGNERKCIPQKDSPSLLQSLGDRMMYRLAYRNMGAHQVLLVNHSVQGSDLTPSAIRWYELRVAGDKIALFQHGTYAPDGAARWMGSIAMDRNGDILLGYNFSGLGTSPSFKFHPSIAITGRRPGDPQGLAKEIVVVAGLGNQSSERWGDYSSIALDPADDCTFWLTSQYQSQTGIYVWRTNVSRVKFKGCQ
jgi:hypothetical protein